MAQRPRRLALLAVLTLVLPLAVTGQALADPDNNSPAKLTKAVTLDGVLRHLDAFQSIADTHGDRAAGRPGYQASVNYVVSQLSAAGYSPSVQEFDFPYVEDNSRLDRVAPVPRTFQRDNEFTRNGFTPTFEGDVTGVIQPVDVIVPPAPVPNTSSSGCEAADFAGFAPGRVAMLQRGTCGFSVKALNAQAAGAAAVILFNEGQPGRTGLTTPIGDTPGLAIPVVFATYAAAEELILLTPGATVRVKVDFTEETRKAWNVFAESRDGNANNVVMAGAHLDSVQDGPGINDNGSGTAALLETAIHMKKVKTNAKVRFAWWGAEEEGLLGSEHYIATLPQADQDKIALYLNFDMVGSPNHFFGIYDGDDSSGTAPVPIPPGSAQIEDVFEKFYADRGLPSEDTDFSGRSDYGPFIAVNIPAGGLFTGAEDVKTAEQAARYGGTAGIAFDPCYHQPCDTRSNLNLTALDVNADAIATAVITFAFDTSTVNGVRAPGKSHGRAPQGSAS
ncbi:M20/M25/M40 family metallo-hydrolase [Lentzea albidocapillata]|uniref:Aminopeptidase Y n=1 Tax=Lentzea albidocapillata TaxID=40571 RepID=A0A1W2CWK2_9PSEU|nr:M20/M25/M40 family metallo-hydrolase [Lentzea albidocapillata]SMC89336.1 aminopeptidase Y [Lentzea albidocapillata]